jgi:putative ABC transport system permease protein
MFQHHLLLIYRNFKKYKSSFFINLIGLSASLCCALLIYLWVNDEVEMDKFHAKNDRLYKVMQYMKTAQGDIVGEATPGILAQALKSEMPQVDVALTASPTYWLEQTKLSSGNQNNIKAAGKFAGKDFFKVFSYALTSGNINRVLTGKQAIVISENLAMKLFHTTQVLGKEIVWSNVEMQNETHSIVTGVFKDTPANSSDHFDFLVSLDVLYGANKNYSGWGAYGPNTFIVLKKGVDPAQVNAKIRNFMQSKGLTNPTLFIIPYADAYLHGLYTNGVQTGGRIEYVRLFSLIAIFILVIACINFMNLSTARASRRMKEVGIKKVMGAGRRSLIIQYLSESLLLTTFSLFIALLCVEIFLPQFNDITGKNLSLHFDGRLLLIIIVITVFTGLVSGSYPAVYMSGFNPAVALKGKLVASASALWTRRGLVIFQFTLSVVLIVCVFVVYKQVEFVQHKNMGYQKENVVYIEAEGKVKTGIVPFLAAVKKIPGVVNASSMDRGFLGEFGSTEGEFRWEGKNSKEVIKFQNASINTGLIETLGMEMAAGRSFSDKFGADSTKILINEEGIRVMGLKKPVGKIFGLWGQDYQIVGVVKNFNYESLHEPVKPLFFRYAARNTNRVLIRIQAGQEKQTLAALHDFYTKYNPGFQFEYRFLDQDFQAQYVAENRVAVLSRYFAGLAVIISCLGLFGLAAFTAERMIKEIGIRKVLGASEWNIVYRLSGEFIKPVGLSMIIALPLSYILARYWLNSFAYRIDLHLWYFIAAGMLALVISWLTVGLQAVKAARMNPIQCLRDE